MAERRESKGVVLGACVGVAVAALTWAAPAAAHISLENGGTHKSRYGDGELKAGPCGRASGKRGTNIYTYAPGQTITVKVVENIGHTSYFRFAFDNDGDDGFMEPRTIKPIDPGRKCPTAAADKCGASDFNNNSTVLMDNLSPHCGPPGVFGCVATDAGAAVPNGAIYSWDVKLPDVECTNCTLQIIQVMEDDGAHGPYNPANDDGSLEDIYHQCIDLVLKRPADGGTTDASTGGTGGATSGTTTTGTGGATTGTGGAGTTTGTGGATGGTTTGTGGATTGTGGATGGTTTGTGGATTGTGGATGGTTTGTGGATTGTGAGGSGTGGTATTGGSGGAGGSGNGGSAGSGTTGTGTAGSSGPGSDDGGCSVSRGPLRKTGVLAGWAVLGLALVSRRRRR